MEEAVNKQDIIKGDPLKEIAKDADVLYESLKKVDGEIRKTAQAFTDLSKVEKTTLEGISKINQANETANKLYKQTIENEKTEQKLLREREKLKKQQERERLQEIRLQQQREKAFDKYEKQLQREKKLIADQNNSYRQLTARVNEAQAEFKQLAAQYGLTDKRTIQAHKRFVQIDNDLRKINNAARDGRRDVGRYGLALEKVKGSFGRIAGTLGVAFGATAIVGEIRELNTLANEAQGVEFAFQRIGVEAQSAFDRIKTSTRGLLSDLDIKKSIVEFDNFNLSLEQSDTLFEFLSVRAAQTGKSVENLRDSLVEGLSKESKLRIDNLGISAMDLNAELEKTPNFIDAVANIAKREVEEAGSILDDAASSQEKWNAALQNTRLEIAKKLKPTLDDLFETGANLLKWFASNLETILSVVGKLTKGFISFKVAMFALKMKDRITEWIDYRKAVGNAADGLDETSKSAKSFGKALKGIGWAAAIALAYEFVTALKDIVTGAHQAEEALKALEERQTKGLSEANDKIEGSQGRLLKQLKDYKKQLDSNKISQSQYNKLVDQAEKDHQIRLEKGIELEIKRREAAGKALEKIQELRKENGEFLSDAIDFADDFDESFFGVEGFNSFQDAETKLAAVIDASGTIINRYKEGIKETVQLTDDLVKSTKDLGDVAEEQSTLLQQLIEQREIAKKELESLITVETSGSEQYILDKKAEIRLLNAKIEKVQFLLEIEEIGNLKVKKLESEAQKLREEGIQQSSIQIEQKKEDAKTEEELLKERYDTIIGFEEAITQALMDQIDKRIELSKKEQDAAKNAQDYLQQLAANGNIKAEQSIASEIQIQKDAIAEQERLEKRKAQLELISSGLQTYSAEIGNGKSAAEAFTSTITSTKLLADFLKNLSFFAEGTDNAPGGFAVVDEEGAEIITDKHDKIKQIGTNKGARLTKLDAGDKVITAPKTLELMSAMNIPTTKLNSDSMGNSFDLMRIEKGLKSVENAVKNNATRYDVRWDSFGNLIETRRKGGDRRTSRHRI